MRGSANIYNLPEHLQARSMCAVTADSEQHRFVLGSSSIFPASKSKNEIHLLSYSEDANRIDVEHVFTVDTIGGKEASMSPEVTVISSSPYNRNVLVVGAHNHTESNAVLFYQLASSQESGEIDQSKLSQEFIVKNTSPQATIHSIVWEDCEPMEGKTPAELLIAD